MNIGQWFWLKILHSWWIYLYKNIILVQPVDRPMPNLWIFLLFKLFACAVQIGSPPTSHPLPTQRTCNIIRTRVHTYIQCVHIHALKPCATALAANQLTVHMICVRACVRALQALNSLPNMTVHISGHMHVCACIFELHGGCVIPSRATLSVLVYTQTYLRIVSPVGV